MVSAQPSWRRVAVRVAVSGLVWGYCLGRLASLSLSLPALIGSVLIAVNASTPRLLDAQSAKQILPLRRQVRGKMIPKRSIQQPKSALIVLRMSEPKRGSVGFVVSFSRSYQRRLTRNLPNQMLGRDQF